MWLLLNFAEQWRTDEMRSSGWRPRILQKLIADALRLEIAPPGKVSRHRVVWWSIDHASYAVLSPACRTWLSCISCDYLLNIQQSWWVGLGFSKTRIEPKDC